jgi:signal transduction histidine kinase
MNFEGEHRELKLTVINTVEELDEQDLPHLFERLWRKDPSRTSTMHSGLGLALVKACTERVGGIMDCALKDRELSMQLRTPLVLLKNEE